MRHLGRLQTRARELGSLIRLTIHEATSMEGRSRERHRRILLSSLTNLGVKCLALLVNLVVVRLVLGTMMAVEFPTLGYSSWAGRL